MGVEVKEALGRTLDGLFESLAIERYQVAPGDIEKCRRAQEDLSRVGMHFVLPELLVKRESITLQNVNEILGLIRSNYWICPECAVSHPAGSSADSINCSKCGQEINTSVSSKAMNPYSSSAQGRYAATLSSVGLSPDMDTFGDYDIVREVGRGGMGVVYEAREREVGRRVALKLLPPAIADDSESLARFQREARSAGQLQHPGIVKIFNGGVTNGIPFITMEFAEGVTMDKLLAQGPIDHRRALKLIHKVAEALHYAHEQGLIHRDIKPSNIIVGPDDSVKVMDFGLAIHSEDSTAITLSGIAVGTPAFMPPEQALGQRERIGPWSDTYMLGATLYEAVCGSKMFDGERPEEIIAAVVERDPAPPRRLQPSISHDLEAVILKAVDKEQMKRYVTAQALADDLQCLIDGKPVAARPVSKIGRIMRKARRRKVTTAILASCTVLILFLATYVTVLQVRKWRDEEKLAIDRKARAEKWSAAAGKSLQGMLAADVELQDLLLQLDALYKKVNPGKVGISKEAAELLPDLTALRRKCRGLLDRMEKELSAARENLHLIFMEIPDRPADRRMERDALLIAATAHQRMADADNRAWDERRQNSIPLDYAKAAFYARAAENVPGLGADDRVNAILHRASGEAGLTITTDPPGIEVNIQRVDPESLSEGEEISLGRSPVEGREFPMGSYVIRLWSPDHADAVVPVLLERNEEKSVHVKVLKPGDVPPDMVYVSGGTGTFGDSWLDWTYKKTLKPYFIDRMEVSFSDYWNFLESIPENEMARRLPRINGVFFKNGNPAFQLPAVLDDKPVVAISVADAEAYAKWLGKRLPTREEWEFAARGADGRDFPWGDKFVGGRANSRERWGGKSGVPWYEQMESVDTRRGETLFGCYHMSGNVAEIVKVGDSWFTSGGNYALSNSYCRIGPVFTMGGPSIATGFRCVRDVPE